MIETKFKIELCLLKNRKLPRPNLLLKNWRKGMYWEKLYLYVFVPETAGARQEQH